MKTMSFYSSKSGIPIPVEDLSFWLLAGQGVTKNSFDKVIKWDDQSGNGNYATVMTSPMASNPPLWLAGDANGQPSIFFNNSDLNALTLNMPVSVGNNQTIYVIMKQISSSDLLYVLAKAAHPQSYWAMYYTTFYEQIESAAAWANVVGYHGAYHMYNTIIDATTFYMYVDQILKSSMAIAASSAWDTIGWRWYTYALGYIAEIIIYDKALSSPERAVIESYLKTKYGI